MGLSRSSTPQSRPFAAGQDDFRAGRSVAGDVSWEGVDVGHDNGFTTLRGRAADALAQGNPDAGDLALEGPEHEFGTP
jgi:hypothetical protein